MGARMSTAVPRHPRRGEAEFLQPFALAAGQRKRVVGRQTAGEQLINKHAPRLRVVCLHMVRASAACRRSGGGRPRRPRRSRALQTGSPGARYGRSTSRRPHGAYGCAAGWPAAPAQLRSRSNRAGGRSSSVPVTMREFQLLRLQHVLVLVGNGDRDRIHRYRTGRSGRRAWEISTS